MAFIEGVKNVIADGFSRLCPQELDADLEQPIRTITMFLDSYSPEESAIDKKVHGVMDYLKQQVPFQLRSTRTKTVITTIVSQRNRRKRHRTS